MKIIYVPLTGGLGNQLFQLSAALSLNPHKVILTTRYGKPRRDSSNKVEISNWKLPENVIIVDDGEAHLFFQKCVGYLLRSGINPRDFERNPFWRAAVRYLGMLCLSLDLKSRVEIFSSDDVGYSQINLSRRKPNVFLIGYFQSHKYLIPQTLDSLSVKLEFLDDETLSLYSDYVNDQPTCIHVRLGDYLIAEEFGTPSAQYYLDAIRKICHEEENLWIFSDDIEGAKEKLKLLDNQKIRWFDRITDSDTKTLQVMSFCEKFVLSNSTFGWWAAMLSRSQKKIVICPEPWFLAMPEPEDLVPAEWIRRNAGFGK